MSASIWNNFNKVPGKTVAKCILCKKEYSYKTSITNLKRHLQHKHVSAYEAFLNQNTQQNRPTNVSIECSVSTVNEQTAGGSTSQNAQQNTNLQCGKKIGHRKQKHQVLTTHVPHNIDEKRTKRENVNIDQKLLRMITQDYQPFSIVEDLGFKSFVEALNPSYKLPNRKLISGTSIPEQYIHCKNKIKELVQEAKNVCLTTECWSSMAMDSYLAVTAHFLINFEIKTVLLHCEQFIGSDTADELAAILRDIASEWGITDKITLMVSPNASNITNAIRETGWPFFGCFLHKLNLIIEKALEKIDFILENVKKIVSYFKKNHLATEALIKYQRDFEKKAEALRIIQSVPTRWNSVYYMLERFLKLQGALQAVIPKLKADLKVITVEMWELIKQVCFILKPFEEVTRVMSDSHYLTGSLAIILVEGLKNVLAVMKTKPAHGAAVEFLIKLEEGINCYFPENEIEDNMVLGICTLLDPRFKIYAFTDKNIDTLSSDVTNKNARRACLIKEHVLELLKAKFRAKRNTFTNSYLGTTMPSSSVSTGDESETLSIWKKMDKTIAAVTPYVDDTATKTEYEYLDTTMSSSSVEGEDEIETLSIWGKMDKTIAAITPCVDDISSKARKELDLYLNEDVVQREVCPINWWKTHGSIYPNLAEIFHENCHIVVTSVDCEKAFSKAGNLMMQKRARLSRKRTPEVVFLKSNEAYCT